MVREPVLRAVLRIAGQIVHNEISPYEGAAGIWGVLAEMEGEYHEEFRIFVGLASEWQDQPDHRDAYEADIREEAQALLQRHAARDLL